VAKIGRGVAVPARPAPWINFGESK